MVGQPRNPLGLDLEVLFGASPQQAPPQAAPAPPAAPKMGRVQLIAGILADALAGAAGQQGPFAARMARQQQQEAEEAQWHRRRSGEREDKQWEWENKPRDLGQPHRWEDNAGNVWERGADGRNVRIFTDTAPKTFVHEGMLNYIPNPYAATAAPVVPQTIDEETFNAGTPVGGQPPAAGNFPRRSPY